MISSPFSCIFVAILLMLMTTTLYAQSNALSVDVQRIKQIQGQLHYQLFACPTSKEVPWPELKPLITRRVDIKKEDLQLSIASLESGQYIFRAYQDLNANGQLDFSDNGVPKEPTGFSNNPSLFLGYPKPIDSCFLYDANDQAKQAIIIKLNNKRKRKRRKVR